MTLYIPKEVSSNETRIPLLPEAVQKLVGLGIPVQVEAGLGTSLLIPDEAYTEAGARIASDPDDALRNADIVLRLNPPDGPEGLKTGAVHISYLEPFEHLERVQAFATAGISTLCMEMIPRTTLAQKMDALSSQASLAGYAAVLQAAARLSRSLPMMMTPAGTLAPCKVFVIGAGVAGLQAIATAKRLGARVEAFDTRPAVQEQVESLGAKFLKIDLGEMGETAGGYAKELTPEQIAIQKEAQGKAIAKSDIVITTAKLFGRPAPRLIEDAQIAAMAPGSVIVDMAAGSGGNVEGSEPDRDVVRHGVTLIGDTNLEGRVPRDASQMYGNNLANLVEHFWDKEQNAFRLDLQDEILKQALVTHQGRICHDLLQQRISS
jgi:NAD(P) transhydrogenase subunit alpha